MTRDARAARWLVGGAALLALSGCLHAPLSDSQRDEVSAGSVMRVADATARAGDGQGALAMYKRAAGIAPRDPTPLLAQGRLMADLGRHDEAAAAFAAALALVPEDAEALRGSANADIARDRPQAALATLDRLLRLRPGTVAALNSRGVALDLLGRHAEAAAAYRAALAVSPDNLPARNNLALSLALAGRYAEGLAAIEPVAAGNAQARDTARLLRRLADGGEGGESLDRLRARIALHRPPLAAGG